MLVSPSFTTVAYTLPKDLCKTRKSGENYRFPMFSVSGNLSLGDDLSVDLWENFMSEMPGLSNYPDVGDYDPDSISFFKPPEGKVTPTQLSQVIVDFGAQFSSSLTLWAVCY